MQFEALTVDTYRISEMLNICDDAFSLCYIDSGCCALFCEGMALNLRAGEAFLLQSGIEFRLEGSCTLIVIRFTKDQFYRMCMPALEGNAILNSFFVHESGKPTVSCLYFTSISPEPAAQIRMMQSESAKRQTGFEAVLVCELLSLLLQLSRTCRMSASVTEAPNSQLLQQLLDYMTRNYRTVTMEDLARAFSYHPNSITVILKKGTGKTFSDLLLQIRMGHAANLLEKTDMTVKRVAEECGYSNMSNFYARFSAYFGMTPAEYARSVRGA